MSISNEHGSANNDAQDDGSDGCKIHIDSREVLRIEMIGNPSEFLGSKEVR